MDHLPLTQSPAVSLSPTHDFFANVQHDLRLVRSEHGSPGPTSLSDLDLLATHVPPLDLSFSTMDHFAASPVADDYPPDSSPFGPYKTASDDQPLYSATLSMPPVDWSGFEIESGSLSAAYSQPPSYASFEQNLSYPGLTASSSGEVSEAEESVPRHGLPSPGLSDHSLYPTSSTTEKAGLEPYGLSTLSYHGLNLSAGNDVDAASFDAPVPNGTASPADFEDTHSATHSDPDVLLRHPFTIQEAQKLAHPTVPPQKPQELTIPPTKDNADPIWGASYQDDEAEFGELEANLPLHWLS